MNCAYRQTPAHLSQPAEGIALAACNRRLLAAGCVSLILHGLWLTLDGPYRRDFDLSSEASARRFSVTLHAPASSDVEPAPSIVGRSQARFDVPRHPKRFNGDIDSSGDSSPPRSQSPSPVQEAGDLATRQDSSPLVDVEAARDMARTMARARPGNPAVPRQEPLSTEHETALERSIARSSTSDCRTAYAGAGLFAIPFLIRDVVSDGGCKW